MARLRTCSAESNMSLQDRLYQLRSETKDAFDQAKSLEARWKEIEREQKEVYQVGLRLDQLDVGLT